MSYIAAEWPSARGTREPTLSRETDQTGQWSPPTVVGEGVLTRTCVIHVHVYAYPSQASDAQSTGKVLTAIVQMCFDLQEWELLNEHILLLTKKRGQLKTVASASCIH